jgi:hypothetical protein
MGRNRRGNRQGSMKARLGIATAVLVGGGAIGVAAVAAHSYSPATTTAQSDAFTMNFHHRISEQTAVSSAISTWGRSQSGSLTTLAEMAPMRTFSQAWRGHTLYAAQRGVVVLATRRFLLVRSAHGALHLWWLTGGTVVMNVADNPMGMVAMTGSQPAARSLSQLNMAPAAATMAGSPAVANQMAAPVSKPTTITVDSGTDVITITITSTTATVTQPGTIATVTPTTTATATPPTTTVTATATATATSTAAPTMTPTITPTMTATGTQPPFNATRGIMRGDLVFVAGVRMHGFLIAKLVLYAAPTNVTPAPTVTPTVTVTPTGTSRPTGAPTATSTSAFSGTSS